MVIEGLIQYGHLCNRNPLSMHLQHDGGSPLKCVKMRSKYFTLTIWLGRMRPLLSTHLF
nr:hypothetical protein Iba_scaffold60121CG0010 [Ipomoea batatas]GMD51749.1 hypothetical protein Iba_chr11bCG5290 [Ipomoea batatas]GMD58624.1 hypothetical protein Iba_chr11fCG7340 [Ipomoea batatas]